MGRGVFPWTIGVVVITSALHCMEQMSLSQQVASSILASFTKFPSFLPLFCSFAQSHFKVANLEFFLELFPPSCTDFFNAYPRTPNALSTSVSYTYYFSLADKTGSSAF
jgi:hypothetical protein